MNITTRLAVLAVVLGSFLRAAPGGPGEPAEQARRIMEAVGLKGGLVVHVGCGDGRLTAALRVNDRYLVQGLDTDPARVDSARRTLAARGLYGPVSVAAFDGRHLPYADQTVNLLVAADLGEVTGEEVQRVLAPGAAAYVRRSGTWHKHIKPYPDQIDQWSHFLHDAGGNAVAHDRQIGPPKRLRWVAGPRWCRSHEFPSSVNAVVTAGGRIFTIFDEGPTGVYKNLPQKCMLVARDAWNGLLLWKVPLRRWQPEFGTGLGNRWNIHHTIPRRLVTDGRRVYVTLAFLDSPVSVLDAATGEILVEGLEGTSGADELLLLDGVLIAKLTPRRSVGATERFDKDCPRDTLAAVDVNTRKQLWRKEGIHVVPYALAAAEGRVVYHDLDQLVCLDARTGAEKWQAPDEIGSTLGALSTLVVTDGVVLFNGQGRADGSTGKRGLYLSAYRLDDGGRLWRRPSGRGQAGACTQPTDLFVIAEEVWCDGSLEGYDLRSGRVRRTVSLAKLISPGHHYRCFRSKATDRYLIWPKRGAEFIDLEQGRHMRNDWLRAPCFTGLTPANGLLYVPPSQCFCYPGVLVSGFLAFSSDKPGPFRPSGPAHLQRGPAYGTPPGQPVESPDDWPMYRRNARRSGSTETSVPARLRQLWRRTLACRASQPVVAGERLWLAETDAHRIRCLDAATGRDIWSFTAAGRIDSSPTVYAGLVLFGCRDGSVYCLRASDGELVWRFDAAPENRQVVSFEQLESAWPVHGSVLVQDGTVYFAAGRSSFLDGGIMVYALHAQTGQLRASCLLEGPWPDINTDVGTPFAMEGALPDLLVSDGRDLYMRRIKFDPQLNRLETPQESPLGELDMGADHLVATGGLLDDTGFDRLYWMYGRRWPGFYFAQHAPKSGQLVVFDETTTYAVKYFYRRIQWSPAFFPGENGYLLFADDNENEPAFLEKGSRNPPLKWLPAGAYTDTHRRGGRGVEKGTGYVRRLPAKWQKMIPLRVRAMVLAGEYLFAAGTPDKLDPKDPLAAFEGRSGALLQVFRASDGSQLGSYSLPEPPAFDGLSAARGRLYLATRPGSVVCFGR